MMNARTRATLTAVLMAACAKTRPAVLAAPVVVPFELRHDLVVVRVEVNGQTAMLALDTGAGGMALDSAFAHQAGVAMSWHQALVNDRPAPLATARSVRVGSAPLADVMVVVTDISAVQDRVGHDVRGVIGYDLFNRYVVAIDYDARTVTLSEPSQFTYRGPGTVVPLRVENRLPVVDASLVTRRSGTLPVRLHIDLGSGSYALRLGARVVKAHDLEHDTATVTGPFGASVGGVSQGQLLRMPQLKLGTLIIERPSTALSHEMIGPYGPAGATDGTIGEPVFRRMHLIIDYSRSQVIMEPRGRLDLPDTVDASGLTLITANSADRALRVADVIAGGAGDKAGVRDGDEIVRIDDRPAASLSSDQARALLRADGVTRRLTLRRGDQTVEVWIALKMIV